MIQRNKSGQFVKGFSGNPGGRPTVAENIRELARQHTGDAIITLLEIAKNPKSSDAARVSAANSLLDRAWGKPHQYVESVNMKMDLFDFLDSLDSEANQLDVDL